MGEVDPAGFIRWRVIILMKVVARERVRGNSHSRKDDVVTSLEEPELRIRIGNDWNSCCLEHRSHCGSVVAGHPQLS